MGSIESLQDFQIRCSSWRQGDPEPPKMGGHWRAVWIGMFGFAFRLTFKQPDQNSPFLLKVSAKQPSAILFPFLSYRLGCCLRQDRLQADLKGKS